MMPTSPAPVVLVAEGGGAPTVGPLRGAVVVALVALGAFLDRKSVV